MTVSDFLHMHLRKEKSPTNIIDFKLTNLARHVQDQYSIPDIIWNSTVECNLQRQMESLAASALLPQRQTVLLFSEAEAVTEAHTDYTATSVMYYVMMGAKTVKVLKPDPHNIKLLEEWIINPSL